MREMIDAKFDASINSCNHKDGVHRAISSFHTYKANSINIDPKNKKDKGKLGQGKDKFNNDFFKHCNTSNDCNREWGALGCTQLYELPVRSKVRLNHSLIKNK